MFLTQVPCRIKTIDIFMIQHPDSSFVSKFSIRRKRDGWDRSIPFIHDIGATELYIINIIESYESHDLFYWS